MLHTRTSHVRGVRDASVGQKTAAGASQLRHKCWHNNNCFTSAPSPLMLPFEKQHRVGLPVLGGRSSRAARVLAHASQQLAEAQQGVVRMSKCPDNLTFHFTCPYQTAFGERICLVGSLPEMGSWKPDSAMELKWHEGHLWKLSMPLPRARSTFEFKVVVVSDSGSSRWEEGNNRVMAIDPELLQAPLDVGIDCWLEFENTDTSRVQVLVHAEAVRGPLELTQAWLELQDTRRARVQDALSRETDKARGLEAELAALEADASSLLAKLEELKGWVGDVYMCVSSQGLEAELAELEADASSLLAKLEELKGKVGDQSLEEGATVVLATEPGQISIPELLSKSLPPLSEDTFGQAYADEMNGPQSTAGEASGLEVSIDPSALPLAANGNGAGLEPTAAALAAMQQRQQEEAEEKVRILEEAHRRQVEEVAALAAAEQREAEWQAQVQQQLARAKERQQQQLAAQQQRQQQQQQQLATQQQRQQETAQPSSSSKAEPASPASSAAPASHSNPRAAPAAAAASASGQLEGLAAWISSHYMGMGRSAAEALSELRRRGIVCTGRNLFQLPGHPDQLDAEELAQVLRLQARTPSRPSTPPPSRPTAPSTPAARPSAAAPAATASAASAPADSNSEHNLLGLADFISSQYMGMGKTAKDALPELHRKAITAESPHRFVLNGIPMSAPEVAEALRLQPRTPSQPVTPSSSRPVSPSPKARSGPRAALRGASPPRASPAGSRSGSPSRAFDSELEGLAAWISEKYEGMGKSAADTLPELRRRGVKGCGWNLFSLPRHPEQLDGEGVARVLRLQARPDSRSSSPSRSTSPIRTPAPAPIQPIGSPAASPAADSTKGMGVKAMEGLADFISTNFMGMGKTATDALPELRRAGITTSGNSFVLGGQLMSAPEVAGVLRLQPRTISRPSTPLPARTPATPSTAPASSSTPAAAPAAPTASHTRASAPASSMEALASYISSKYMGMGKTAKDVLPELRRKGITAGGNGFVMGDQVMDADGIAQALRLQARTPSRPSTPIPSRVPATPAAASASYSALPRPSPSPSSPGAPTAAAGGPAAAPAARPAGGGQSAELQALADWISTNFMGMGKSVADALPELRRRGISPAGGNRFTIAGNVMDAPGIARALRVQPRTPSRSSTPRGSRSASPQHARPAYPAPPPTAAPAASAASPSSPSMESLAAYISTNYMGMGKTPMDTLPELRQKGITASGSSFMMGSQVMSAPEIASALRLQPRTPSRPSTPIPPSVPTTPSAAPTPAPASSPAPAPAAPAASASGSLDSLAAWISANYMGMGKSAADALPELRRKGITASGDNFVMGGRLMSAPEIASALRLKPRAANRPISPAPGASVPQPPSSQAPAPSAAAHSPPAPGLSSAAPGLDSLADFIASNYEGMGKSALDVLPELRRKGIVANSDSTYSIQGRKSQLSALEVAGLLRLKARPGSSQRTAASRSNVTASAEVTSAETAEAGVRWLASWIAQKYVGMGKTEADALPELKRRGITCTSMKGGQRMFSMAGQPTELSATELANLLQLRAR